jgi:hypothetical protein
MTICDEAHYIVSTEFNWISKENEPGVCKQFNSYRKYYLTATLKETISDTGLGMNNSELFGPIICEKTPLEMINAGEIVRPRMHCVSIENADDSIDVIDKDVNAIINAFIEHRVHCKTGAKMLVVTKGSGDLNRYVTHPKMKKLLSTRPFLKIFDISSAFNPRINGEIVKRDRFLNELQTLQDYEDAIIFHINILTEGIDVPGITGIMPMSTMGLGRFLQTLGRATRLHPIDRMKLYAKEISPNDLDDFVKPYSWVIIPTYGDLGEDLKEQIEETIYALRDYGFNAAEDIVIKENKGRTIPVPIGGVNNPDTRVKALFDVVIKIEHTIESKVEADKLAVEDFRLEERIKNMSDEELVKIFI